VSDLVKVNKDGWRMVMNARRARKLRNRNEDIRWSVELQCWMWLPEKKVAA
jgi:hypothetical protein